MIAEAIQKIIDIQRPEKVTVGRKVYWPGHVTPFTTIKPEVKTMRFHSLDAIAKMLVNEAVPHALRFIEVVDATTVRVFTHLDNEDWTRQDLYTANADIPGFSDGYRGYEQFVIELRSRFIENTGSKYLLDLLSKIDVNESSVSEDNGVTQQVIVRKGIALKESVVVKPIVSLRPYRTFMEVEQPESEFLVRVDREGSIGLFEADGGMWQQQAKTNIAAWLEKTLAAEIEAGLVIVMK